MRPIRLEMNAFGPYQKRSIIDFTQFIDGGIFLITGNTGAGKTSIFDALSFALYGSPSGNIRKVSMLRNASADFDQKTYVKLTFEYLNKQYTITRNPSYKRLKKSGEGTTIENAQASLELETGEIISGNTLVDEKILELLKINQNQFSQIVMIAQNDFLKFLSSNTSDRQSILRTIFNTNFYLEFENELKIATAKEKQILDNLHYEYSFNLKQVLNDEESQLNHQSIVDKLGELIKASHKEIKAIEENLSVDNKQLNALNQQLTVAKENNQQLTTFEKYEKDYHLLEANAADIEAKKLKLNYLNIIQKEIINVDNNYQTSKKALVKANDEIAKIQSLLNDNNKSLLENSQELAKISNYQKEIDKLKEQITILNKQIPTFKEVEAFKLKQKKLENKVNVYHYNIVKQLSELKQVIQRKEALYQKALKAYNNLKLKQKTITEKYNNLEAIFLDNQAALIASKLNTNEPCPVCGALDHPQLAKLKHENIESEYFESKQLVEKINLKVSEDLKILEALKAQSSEKRNQYQNYHQIYFENQEVDIDNLLANINKATILDLSLSELLDVDKQTKKQINDLKIQIRAMADDLVYEDLVALNKVIIKHQTAVKKYESLIEKINAKTKKLEAEKLTLDRDLLNYQKQQAELLTNSQILKAELSLLISSHFESSEKYFALKSELPMIDSLSKTVSEFESNLIKAKSLYLEYVELTKNKAFIDTKILTAKTSKLNEAIKLNITNLNKLISDLNKYQTAFDILTILDKKIVKQEMLYRDYLTLSNSASGNVTSKAKIQFETYAQIAYFEKILAYANQRLAIMSNHQYELVRKTAADNLVSQSGLELDVYDHHFGNFRSVNTLSGGEAFNASLALALGLSDTILEMSGGIQIDALFIDEGFGNLSDDYLENAIKTLIDVSDNNRLIGVISHVKALSEEINQQIVVSKTDEGSVIEIIK